MCSMVRLTSILHIVVTRISITSRHIYAGLFGARGLCRSVPSFRRRVNLKQEGWTVCKNHSHAYTIQTIATSTIMIMIECVSLIASYCSEEKNCSLVTITQKIDGVKILVMVGVIMLLHLLGFIWIIEFFYKIWFLRIVSKKIGFECLETNF
jgi:hypothetical protein